MLTPLPTQLSGAKFLAERKFALLADEPRVGKTGAAILGADDILANKILVVTTASGRSVWRRDFPLWSKYPRRIQVLTPGKVLDREASVVIVSWQSIVDPKLRVELLTHKWDLLIGDEDHYAKNFEAKRTQAFFGTCLNDGILAQHGSLCSRAARIWVLTGTPCPNSLFDMYPRLRALAPELLLGTATLPDVFRLSDFKSRYCITRPMRIGRGSYGRRIDVIVGGKNETELRDRIGDFMLRRTQADVGIRAPIHELFPLMIDDRIRRGVDRNIDLAEVLEAAENGDTRKLEMHLGPLRRLTGELKAHSIVQAAKEEFECGLDKLVLMRWHTRTGEILRDGLQDYGVVSIDGSTSARDRDRALHEFTHNPLVRVFDGQIQAAGEAIDLSAAAVLWFVESSFIPKDMLQASLRITNHEQRRQAVVRVATLEGSIDESVQAILLRKWSSIGKVLQK